MLIDPVLPSSLPLMVYSLAILNATISLKEPAPVLTCFFSFLSQLRPYGCPVQPSFVHGFDSLDPRVP